MGGLDCFRHDPEAFAQREIPSQAELRAAQPKIDNHGFPLLMMKMWGFCVFAFVCSQLSPPFFPCSLLISLLFLLFRSFLTMYILFPEHTKYEITAIFHNSYPR